MSYKIYDLYTYNNYRLLIRVTPLPCTALFIHTSAAPVNTAPRTRARMRRLKELLYRGVPRRNYLVKEMRRQRRSYMRPCVLCQP